jgi:hypothetical protein
MDTSAAIFSPSYEESLQSASYSSALSASNFPLMCVLGSIGCISWLAHRLARSRVTASPKSDMPLCLNS